MDSTTFTDDELFEVGALLLEHAQAARAELADALAAGKHEAAEDARRRALTLLSALRKITAAGRGRPLRLAPAARSNVAVLTG
jgi:hypothetical protein